MSERLSDDPGTSLALIKKKYSTDFGKVFVQLNSGFIFSHNAGFLAEVLDSHGCSLSDLCSVSLLVSSMSDYAAVNAEYVRHFRSNPPIRVCVQPAPARRAAATLSAVGYR